MIDDQRCIRPRTYPAEAARLEQEGATTIEFDVDADGSVTGRRVLVSSGFELLDKVTLDVSRRCTFKPATSDGKPVPGRTTAQLVWKLNIPAIPRAMAPVTEEEKQAARGRRCPMPSYPPGARARQEQGVTDITFDIDPEGWVRNVQIVKSSGYPQLDAASISTIGGCWFKPSQEGTKRIPVRYNWTLD